MKTPSLQELFDKSEKDTTIDPDELDEYSLSIPKLCNEWTTLFLKQKGFHESIAIEYAKKLVERREHYLFKHDIVIEKRGGELDLYINGDDELAPLKRKLKISEEKLRFIEQTRDTISRSSFNIKNSIDFMKFQAGF